MPTYLTTDEAATVLGISPRNVRRYCAEGRLGEKHGRNWAIEADDLERFAAIDRPRGQAGRVAKEFASRKRSSDKEL